MNTRELHINLSFKYLYTFILKIQNAVRQVATVNSNRQRRMYGHRFVVDESMVPRIRNHRSLVPRRTRLDHGPNHRRNPSEHHLGMLYRLALVTLVGSPDLQEAFQVENSI